MCIARTNDRLVLLGTAPSMVDAPLTDETCDVWAVSAYAGHKPEMLQHVDVLFEMHLEHYWAKMLPRLVEFHGPVVMQQKQAQVPNSVEFPFEEAVAEYYIQAMGEDLYATNSVSYMLMLAGMLGYSEIALYGIHMGHHTEYGYQKPNCEYYLGWLAAKGCKIWLPEMGQLLRAPYLYGYNEPWQEVAALKNDQARYEREVETYDRELEELKAKRWRAEGRREYAKMIAHTKGAY